MYCNAAGSTTWHGSTQAKEASSSTMRCYNRGGQSSTTTTSTGLLVMPTMQCGQQYDKGMRAIEDEGQGWGDGQDCPFSKNCMFF